MQKAILPVLKDANGTYPYPTGELRVVDLYCDGVPVKVKEVIVDNTINEFASYATNRIQAIKITSQTCGTVYALGSAKNLINLQNCCNETINYQVNLGCTVAVGGTVDVIDVLGNNMGTVSTPAAYVALWNTSVPNSYIGKLYEKKGWTFTINANVGSYKLPFLACTASAPVYICPVTTITTTGIGNIHVVFTAEAHSSYNINIWSNANGTGLVATRPYTNGSNAANAAATEDFTGITAGTYYVEVRPAGSATLCARVGVTVAGAVVPTVQWEYFAEEPTDLTALNFSHSQNHTIGTDATIDLTDMPGNSYIVFKYPVEESNYLSWVNDINNYGPIPDSNFKATQTVSGSKYIVSQVGLTFTVKSLTFSHTGS